MRAMRKGVFENAELAARCRQNPQARCLRYAGSARFQRAGSGSFQLRDTRKESFQTGSKLRPPYPSAFPTTIHACSLIH